MFAGSCRRIYSEFFRRQVVEDVETGVLTESEAARRYGILGHSTILKWCRKYGRKKYPLIPRELRPMSKEKQEIALLRKELAMLKKELSDEKMKNVVYETMIDIADETFGIDIRKKFGAKQPGK